MYQNFMLRTRKGPHLVVAAYVVQVSRALNFTVRTWKAPHVKKHMVNMASNVASNSREEQLKRR